MLGGSFSPPFYYKIGRLIYVDNIKFLKNEYKKVSPFDKNGVSRFESYFEECSENYSNYLAKYFAVEGGVLKNEFRFINA